MALTRRIATKTTKKKPRKKAKTKAKRSGNKKARGGFSFWWKLLISLGLLLLCGIIYLDALVQHRFSGKKWAIPAKVYARPQELYAGQFLSINDLKEELVALGYRFGGLDGPGTAQEAKDGLLLHTRGFRFWDGLEPAQRIRVVFSGNSVRKVQDLDGDKASTALDLVRLEPLHIGGIYPNHQQDRLLVRLMDAPQGLLNALVVVEDHEFYQHFGLSPRAVLRALLANMSAGRLVQGGSTITQQLVKNFFLSSDRTYSRKLLEAIMSVLLELHFSKPQILQAYMNEVYLGQSGPRAIHGFGLASQHYFNVPISELKLHQYALLVAMVKGPSYYDPWRHPQRALNRRNLVIGLLAEHNIVSSDAAGWARSRPLGIGVRETRARAAYPAYLDLVRRQLRRDYREEDLNSEGLQIFTNFDPLIQWQAEKSLSGTLDSLDKKYSLDIVGEDTADVVKLEGAVVVTSVESGEVQAVVGGRRPRYAGYNRAIDALRPIGSLIKPAVYLSALQAQDKYTLASLISDAPVTVQGPDESLWQPQNFDRQSHGIEPLHEVPLHRAMALSYNQATARLGMQVGLAGIVDNVAKLGVHREMPPLPSVLLGAYELSLMDVARMYQTIAAGGFHSELRAIREIMDRQGDPLRRYPLTVEQRFSGQSMHLLQYVMQEVMREGTARSAYRYLGNDLAVAGKTGTTDMQRDSWFAGFSGDKLSVVWLGRDDNGETPLTGSTGALQVWSRLMANIARQSIIFNKPEGVDYAWVDDNNGLLSAKNCESARYLPFLSGTQPVERAPCRRRRGALLNWLKDIF